MVFFFMGEIDKCGFYVSVIPFDDVGSLKGEVVLRSNDKFLNSFLEDVLRDCLRDIYYGRIEYR